MGKELSLIWAIPFAGMLLSIALFPLLAPHFWHHHFRKVSLGWALLLAGPFLAFHGPEALHSLAHILLLDYVPFLLLLGALYTVSGGVYVRGTLAGTPIVNGSIILVGTLIASFVGTTGASMLLIRPLLRANEKRRYKTHTMVFFIFLVSNIGGSLTPLGDPPLFLGFLHGVPFFWTLTNLAPYMAIATGIVLAAYLVVDSLLYRREAPEAKAVVTHREKLGIQGGVNLLFLAGIIVGVLVSGYWKPNELESGKWIKKGHLWIPLNILDSHPHVANAHAADAHPKPRGAESQPAADDSHPSTSPSLPGQAEEAIEEHHQLGIPMQNLARDGILILMALLSLLTTSKSVRSANHFSWFPIAEVAWLFFGIFVTIIPALAILGAGAEGAMGWLIRLVNTPARYFWASGILSSFLDNAPTYLTFLNASLGQFHAGMPEYQAVSALISEHNQYLVAIASGSVFMGANTYIGNAPNFMVRSIAEEAGVRMPDFFSYIFLYSLPVLGTTFVIVTRIFFWG